MFGNVYIVKKTIFDQYKQNTFKRSYNCYVTQDDNQTNSSSTLPIDKKDVDNSIIDLVVGAGLPFNNVLNNLLFQKMVNKLQCVTNSYFNIINLFYLFCK